MATITPSPNLLSSVTQKLADLRRALYTWILTSGLMRLGLLLVLVIAVDLGLDRLMKMDYAQRVVCLGLMIAILGYYTYRFLLQPMSVKFSDELLCLEVESQNKQLGQGLISAFQFSQITGAENLGVSRQLIDATIRHGASEADKIDFKNVLNSDAMRQNLFIFLATLGLLIGAVVAMPEAMQTWFNRNILLGAQKWPQATQLKVEYQDERTGRYIEIENLDNNPQLILPRGGDLNLRVTASGEIPSVMQINFPGSLIIFGGQTREMVPGEKTEAGGKEFTYSSKNVIDEFRFSIFGGDAETEEIELKLVDRPLVKKLDMLLIPPSYTGLKNRTLPEGKGPYAFFKGSELKIKGTSTKTLEAAVLLFENQRIPLSVDGTTFYGQINPKQLQNGTYRIRLTDTHHRDSKQKSIKMALKRDLPPRVKIQREGVSAKIVTGAQIPVKCLIKDDFKITAATLHYEWSYTDSETKKTVTGKGSAPFDSAAAKLNQKEVRDYIYTFDIAPLKLPVEASLTVHVEAQDNYPYFQPKDGGATDSGSAGPNTGVAISKLIFRVVSEAELRDDLIRREQEQSQELNRLINDGAGQSNIGTESGELLVELRKKPNLTTQQYKKLKVLYRNQKAVGQRCHQIGIRMNQLASEYINNRLVDQTMPGEGNASYRIRQLIVKPLYDLIEPEKGLIIKAYTHLNKARLGDEESTSAGNMQIAVELQKKILQQLLEVEIQMKKSTSMQKVINIVKAIFSKQQGAMDKSIKEAKDIIKNEN